MLFFMSSEYEKGLLINKNKFCNYMQKCLNSIIGKIMKHFLKVYIAC